MSSSENQNNTQNKEGSKNSEDKPKAVPTITFNFIGGFTLCLIIFLLNIGAIVTLLIFLNFLVDSKTYNFDYIGFTRLGKNRHFSLCGSYSCVDNWYYSFGVNFLILSILYFQEVVLTSKWIRDTFVKRAIGDMFFFPKYIIRIISLFNLSMSIMLYQPMNFEDFDVYPKINLTEYFHPLFLYIPVLLGVWFIIQSLHFNFYLNDELGFFMFWKILKGIEVKREGDYIYGRGIYMKVRSPFRAGVMLIFLGFSPKWDLGRALYTAMFWFAMYIEGVNEDRYYFEKYEGYREYIKKVRSRFFDLGFITGRGKNTNESNSTKDKKTEDKENEEEKDENKVKRRRNNNKKKQE